MNGHRDDMEDRKGKQPEEVAMMPKQGWGSKSHPDEEEVEQSCGLGSWRPSLLERLTGMWSFVVTFGLSLLLSESGRTYLASQVLFLERQFELSNKTTGILLSCTDIGYLVFVLFTSYFARKWSIPQVLAISTALFGLASVICVLPHAITQDDLHPPPVVHPNNSLTMEKLLLKSPSCMIGTLPPEALQVVMKQMTGGAGGALGPLPVAPLQPAANAPLPVLPPVTPTKDQPTGYPVLPPVQPGGVPVLPPVKPIEPTSKAVESDNNQPDEEAEAVATKKPVDVAPTLAPNVPVREVEQKTTTKAPPPPPTVAPVQPAAQPKPGEPTLMMPNFTKLATHPQYEQFAMMATQMFQIDLKAVAAMPLRQQVDYVNNLPEQVKLMLPNLKLILGPDADSYFMPQPQYRRKRAAAIKRINPATDMMHNGMLAQMMKGGRMQMLPKSAMNDLFEQLCPFNTGEFHKSSQSASTAIGLIALGMLIQGIARAPRLAFATIYVDDNVEEDKTGLFLGVMYCLSILGAPVTVALGGWAITTYVTLEDTGAMTFYNPRWLSAWWLGYLFFGLIMFILSIPILLFPRSMPGRKSSYTVGQSRSASVLDIKGFAQCLLRLVMNPVFVAIVLANALCVMAISGMFTFIHKYVETQFSLPPFSESVVVGVVYTLFGALGGIIGGIVATRWKLSPVNCLKMTVVLLCAATVVHACTLGLGCDQPHLDKGNKKMTNTSQVLCSDTCICVDEMYAPICGSDGISYYSPCHAGCGEAYDGVFHDCKCVEDQIKTAKPLLCKQPCDMFYGYSVILVLGGFLLNLGLVPSVLAAFRSVEARDAPLAIGFGGFFATLLGVVPGPYIFGSIVDGACALTRPACGPAGPCAYYDIVKFRLHFNGVATAILGVASLFAVVALFLGLRSNSVYKRKIYQKKEAHSHKSDYKSDY